MNRPLYRFAKHVPDECPILPLYSRRPAWAFRAAVALVAFHRRRRCTYLVATRCRSPGTRNSTHLPERRDIQPSTHHGMARGDLELFQPWRSGRLLALAKDSEPHWGDHPPCLALARGLS